MEKLSHPFGALLFSVFVIHRALPCVRKSKSVYIMLYKKKLFLLLKKIK